MTIIGPMGKVFNSPDSVVVRGFDHVPDAEFIVCDDCREAYLEPAYYSWFDADPCELTETDPVTGEVTEIPHDCTFNECPDCAGPYLEPDLENDPRRPAI